MSSLISAMLPQSERPEAMALNRDTLCTGGYSKTHLNAAADLCTRIGRVLLIVAGETASAILDVRYKAFDPIVKNFGCQINAAEVNQLLRSKRDALCEEAVRINAFVQQQLAKKSSKINGERTLAAYLAKVDMPVSDAMARLLRARLLCIVNRDVEKDGKAVPITDISLLAKKITNKAPKENLKGCIQLIVNGLQAEESEIAIRNVREYAELLPDDERKPMIVRALSQARESKVKSDRRLQSPIVSVPLMHNTESCLRAYKGIVCVKNKLIFCDRPIVGAVAKKVFIKMPEEQLVDVSRCEKSEPIIVVEGYIKPDVDLKNRLMEVGFMNMVRTNCARIQQYASGAVQEPIDDPEAADDVRRYASDQYNDANRVMEIDHVFCSSIKEERDEAT